MNLLKNETVAIKAKNVVMMFLGIFLYGLAMNMFIRSEERRVGKEC